MVAEIRIGKKKVGLNNPPFVVAELSGNHNGKLERALELVKAAYDTGADAIKIQTYTADTITWPSQSPEFDSGNIWSGRSLYNLYQEASLPWEWHEPIFKLCSQLGIICFSSPFDETAVDFLENFNVPCYKIASPEIVDLALIRKVAETKKPVIISTGASTKEEIQDAVTTAREAGCQDLILLKCTVSYPASPADANLRTIPDMMQAFQSLVGLSDHSLGTSVAVASVPLGACLIEKHMTLLRSEGGVDSAFSMEAHEFKQLVKEIKTVWQAIGEIHYGALPVEKGTLANRPSLFFVEDLKVGQVVEAKHLRTLRPALGLPPKELESVLGLPLIKNVSLGTPVKWEYFRP